MKMSYVIITAIVSVVMTFITVTELFAHCDRKNGPVARAATEALATNDFSEVAIWVGVEQEEELRTKFDQSLEVYRQGGKSKELAEEYFMETAVRLHRAAEGLPFTGLKPSQPNPPDIEAAEQALETGNFEPVIALISDKMEEKTSKWFNEALEAKKQKDKNMKSGREWVDKYVKYIVYIHEIYQTIEKGPPHGIGDNH